MATEAEETTTRIVAQMKICAHEGKKAPTALIKSALNAFERFVADTEGHIERHIEVRAEYDFKADNYPVVIFLVETEPSKRSEA